MLQNYVRLEEVSKLMGHSGSDVTMKVYLALPAGAGKIASARRAQRKDLQGWGGRRAKGEGDLLDTFAGDGNGGSGTV